MAFPGLEDDPSGIPRPERPASGPRCTMRPDRRAAGPVRRHPASARMPWCGYRRGCRTPVSDIGAGGVQMAGGDQGLFDDILHLFDIRRDARTSGDHGQNTLGQNACFDIAELARRLSRAPQRRLDSGNLEGRGLATAFEDSARRWLRGHNVILCRQGAASGSAAVEGNGRRASAQLYVDNPCLSGPNAGVMVPSGRLEGEKGSRCDPQGSTPALPPQL